MSYSLLFCYSFNPNHVAPTPLPPPALSYGTQSNFSLTPLNQDVIGTPSRWFVWLHLVPIPSHRVKITCPSTSHATFLGTNKWSGKGKISAGSSKSNHKDKLPEREIMNEDESREDEGILHIQRNPRQPMERMRMWILDGRLAAWLVVLR